MLGMTYPPMAQHQVLVPLPPATERASHRPLQRSSQPPSSQGAIAVTSDPHTHRLATRIAASWRGFVLRRNLRARQITMTFLQKKAIVIQCFMRRFFAKQLTALKRKQREELVQREQIAWQTAKLNEFKGSVNWERATFDAAAVKVQRVLRWFFARKRGMATLADCPIQPKHSCDGSARPYLPAGWRRHRSARASPGPASPMTNNTNSLKELARAKGGSPAEKSWLPAPPRSQPPASHGDASTPNRPQLASPSGQLVPVMQSPYSRKYRCPPGQHEVEKINNQMRLRLVESERAAHSEQNEERQRQRWEGIIEQDLETCAAVLQRRFRKTLAQQELHTRQCLKTYLDRNATTVQCAFRCFVAKRRTAKLKSDITGDIWLATRKYGVAQVERMKAEFVWNAFLMIRAATIIQVAFRRFRYLRAFPGPRSGSYLTFEEYAARGPRGLPTGLLQGFPQTVKASTVNTFSESRKKPVLRRHKNPAARRALADLRKREHQQPKARSSKTSADADSSKKDFGVSGSAAAGASRADDVVGPNAADSVEATVAA